MQGAGVRGRVTLFALHLLLFLLLFFPSLLLPCFTSLLLCFSDGLPYFPALSLNLSLSVYLSPFPSLSLWLSLSLFISIVVIPLSFIFSLFLLILFSVSLYCSVPSILFFSLHCYRFFVLFLSELFYMFFL